MANPDAPTAAPTAAPVSSPEGVRVVNWNGLEELLAQLNSQDRSAVQDSTRGDSTPERSGSPSALPAIETVHAGAVEAAANTGEYRHTNLPDLYLKLQHTYAWVNSDMRAKKKDIENEDTPDTPEQRVHTAALRVATEITQLHVDEMARDAYRQIQAIHNAALPQFFGYASISEMPEEIYQAYQQLSDRLIFGYGVDPTDSIGAYVIQGTLQELVNRISASRPDKKNIARLLRRFGEKVRALSMADSHYVVRGEDGDYIYTSVPPVILHQDALSGIPDEVEVAHIPQLDFSPLSREDVDKIRENITNTVSGGPVSSRQEDRVPEWPLQEYTDIQQETQEERFDGSIGALPEGIGSRVQVYTPRQHLVGTPSLQEALLRTGALNASASLVRSKSRMVQDVQWVSDIIRTFAEGRQSSITKKEGRVLEVTTLEDLLSPEETALQRQWQQVEDIGGEQYTRSHALEEAREIKNSPVILASNGKLVLLVPLGYAGREIFDQDTKERSYQNVRILKKHFPPELVEIVVVDGTSSASDAVVNLALHGTEEGNELKRQAGDERNSPQIQVAHTQSEGYPGLVAATGDMVGIFGSALRADERYSSPDAARIALGQVLSLPDNPRERQLWEKLSELRRDVDREWWERSQKDGLLRVNRPVGSFAKVVSIQNKNYVVGEVRGDAMAYMVTPSGELIQLARNIYIEQLVREEKITIAEANELELVLRNVTSLEALDKSRLAYALEAVNLAKEQAIRENKFGKANRLSRKLEALNAIRVPKRGSIGVDEDRLIQRNLPRHLQYLQGLYVKEYHSIEDIPDVTQRIRRELAGAGELIVTNVPARILQAAIAKYPGNLQAQLKAARQAAEEFNIKFNPHKQYAISAMQLPAAA